jgi:hypothetical protein
MADLQHCDRCASAHLIRRLDQVECLDCGMVRVDSAAVIPSRDSGSANPDVGAGPDPTLADEVSRALERVLGGSML